MKEHNLSPEVKKIIDEHIPSVSVLETLFLFYKDPEYSWTPEALALELRSHVRSEAKNLAFLEAHGFLTSLDGQFHYHPKNPELQKLIHLLHVSYTETPVRIIAYIYERPADALKGFADAFKILKG
jgi:hypothetical protein